MMATIEEGLHRVLAIFKNRLQPDELDRFKFTTLEDLKVTAQELQDVQEKSKTTRNLTKIQPFLEAMAQYQGVIEVFLNTSDLLCFVWGPMRFLLLVSNVLNYVIITCKTRHQILYVVFIKSTIEYIVLPG